MNWSLLIDWLILIGFILFLIYLAIVIGSEKSTYKDESKTYIFHQLKFFIPNWWTQTLKEDRLWRFERTDTHYDWYCTFHYYEDEKRDPAEILISHLQEEKIKMDPEPEVQITENSEYLIKNKEVASEFSEFIRIEGTATQNEQERIYYDCLFMKDSNNRCYRFISWASVLNGSVEGPYFEEALSLVEFKDYEG